MAKIFAILLIPQVFNDILYEVHTALDKDGTVWI